MSSRRTRWGAAAAAVSVTALVAAALTVPLSGSASAATAAHPFPAHVAYKVGVTPSASQSTRDALVQHQYDAWKSTYLVHGCASNEYYVSTKGDGDAPNNGTVSEAQGYGMNIVPLMAGYDANAQTEFNGLWQLVKDHKDQYGLMQWQLDGSTCKYADSGTPDSATDGDLDIGYGLILADRQWGGYTTDAKAWLASFWAHDVTSDGHLKCEDDGPGTDTRPSDSMLDHLRAFAAYDTAHDWGKVVARQEAVFSEFTSAYSSGAGLLSDFVVGADTTSPKPAPANYQEDQPDNIVGFNSVRVPWHLGTDALENGSTTAATAYGLAKKESACAKSLSGGNPENYPPHVNLNCTRYSSSDQSEVAFDSLGPAAMAAGDQAWTDAIWNELGKNPYQDAYYGETIKTLVALVMAGDYWNPADSGSGGGGGGGTVVNGGFETGDFTGWTRSGTTAITTSGVHSGTHAAALGSTASATNGDSKISQSFTAPTGTTRLGFFYDVTCPDDVTYDWATATLADTTAGTTSTVLARTCTLGAGWKQVTAPVTAGHSYTLTLVSHDEDNPGDATGTTYDDVTLS